MAKWFEMVTGIEMDHQELLLAGERIYNVKRLINLPWGVTPDMDILPERMLTQAFTFALCQERHKDGCF